MFNHNDPAQYVEHVKQKWKPLVESKAVTEDGTEVDLGFSKIKDSYRKTVTAKLLENTEKQYVAENGRFDGTNRPLNEAGNYTSGMDIADPILISLVRRMAPNLLAYDLVGVQPMSGPTGLIFAIRAYYGNQPVGPLGKPGDARPGFNNGGTTQATNATNGYAANEAQFFEPDSDFTGTGTQSANDGSVAYTAYDTGTGFTTAAGETLGRGLSGDAAWAEMSIAIEKSNVVAVERAVKAAYTFELLQDMKAVHGLDAETEITNMLSTEIISETNREITNTIRKVAKIAPGSYQYDNGQLVVNSAGAAVLGTAGLWDMNVNSDGRWEGEKLKSLLMKINKEANAIAKDTRRGRGNFLIVSSDVASALDIAGKLEFAPGVDNNLTVDDTGNTFVGILQKHYKVYVDPYLLYNEVIVGYKGANQMDAGMFYCPYVPLQLYKAIDPNQLQPRLGFKTRYGIVANPFTSNARNGNNYYRKFKVNI